MFKKFEELIHAGLQSKMKKNLILIGSLIAFVDGNVPC